MPARKSALQVHQALCLPHKRRPRPSGDHAAPPEGSVYCACHELCTPISPSAALATHKAAAARRPRDPQLLLKALCTAPATKSHQKADAAQRQPHIPQLLLKALRTAPATKSALQVHHALCQAAAAQRRPRVPQLLLKALCTAPATKSALQVHQALCLPHKRRPRFSGDHAFRSSLRRLCARHLPRNLHSRFTMV